MTWTPILDILSDLGAATTHSLWLPVLAWTVLALPLWALLERTDRLHPLAEYRLRQVLLAALPLGIVAASAVELLPESASAPSLPSTSIITLPSIETTDVASTAPTWQWMHAVGLLTVVALTLGAMRLGRFLLQTVAAVRVRQHVKVSSAPSVQAQVDRLSDRLEIRLPVQGRTAPEATVPLTLGGLRPTILLPPGLLDKPDALHTTLVHECIHIRRWDDLAHVAERFVAALFAVHPFVERLCRGIAAARERACDAAVLGDNHATRAFYARLLTAFAEGSSADPLGALSLSESPTSLKTRLSAMHSSISNVLSSRLALGTTLVALGLGLTIGVVACSDSVAPSTSPETLTTTESAPSAAAEDEEVFVVVEDQPELVGGIEALQEAVSYPESAKEAGIEGRVIVQFVVDENGDVTNPEIIRSVNKLLDKEAIKAVKAQEFEPGRQDGNPVKVKMSLPVTFRLPGQSDTETARSGTTSKPTPPVKSDDGDTYLVVEDQPELVGGIKALQNSVSYPESAKKAGIEGRAVVQFVVDEKGKVTNPKVTRGVNEALNQAALEAVKAQEFKPGQQNGESVPVRMSLPVTFRLDDGSNNGSNGPSEDAAATSATPKTDPGGRTFEKAGIQVVRVLMNKQGDLLVGDELVEVSNLTDAVHQRITEDTAHTALLYADGAPTDRIAAAETSLRALDLQNVSLRK